MIFTEHEKEFGPFFYGLFGEEWRELSGWCIRVNSAGFATMAHVLHRAGIFPSIGEARRAGWNVPPAPGTYYIGSRQRRKMVIVE